MSASSFSGFREPPDVSVGAVADDQGYYAAIGQHGIRRYEHDQHQEGHDEGRLRCGRSASTSASGAEPLDSCLRALRKGDVLVVWKKLDRLGRNLAHLVNTVQDLSARGVGLRVLAGQGAQIDTTTAAGRLAFGIFAALAEFERGLIRERTAAGLKAAGPADAEGGRKFTVSKAQVRLARELGIRPVTDRRASCVSREGVAGPRGELRQPIGHEPRHLRTASA